MATLKNRRDFLKLYTPPPQENNSQKYRKLIIVIVLSLSFVATEIVAGVIAHSISIISDAIHLICDVLGYFSSFIFLYLSRKPPSKAMTFGYHRMELLGALSNIFIVWTLILFVIFESTHRIVNKEFVEKPLVMIVAATADLLVNIGIYKILHQGPTYSHGLLGNPCQHGHHHHDHHHHAHLHHHQGGHQHEQHSHQEHHHREEQHRKEHSHYQSSKERQEHVHQTDHHHHIHHHQHKHSHKAKQNDQTKTIKSHKKKPKVRSQQLKKIDLTQTKGNDETATFLKINNQFFQDMVHEDKLASQQEINLTIINQDINNDNPNRLSTKAEVDKQNSQKPHENEPLQKQANSSSIGMQAAVLHALSDMIMSIGLIISSLMIFFFGNPNAYDQDVTEWNPWHLCDPIATYIFSITALISTLPVINNSYHLLMNSSPLHLPIEDLESLFEVIPGVIQISHLHVWQLKPGKTLMTAHVVVEKGAKRQVLVKLTDLARQKSIYHTAFQVLDEADVESGVSECEDDHA